VRGVWGAPAAAALALALALPATARAEEAVERAQALFNVGAQAYAQGDFNGAIEAFEEAYRASARSGILFSIAQAHRKQFYVAREPARLRAAIEHYHAYLGKVSTGKHRGIAVEALAELEPIAAKVAPEGVSAALALKGARTRVMVSSAAPGAHVSLDGAPPRPSPLIADVKPGQHTVRVEAEGYVDDQRPLLAVEGGLVALDVPLRERPARLFVRAEDGADVTVDRRLAGRTPLPGPIELAAGQHFVAVTRNGRRPFGEEVKLALGESKSVDVEPGVTGQRVASYLLAAVAGAGAVVGGAFVGVAYHEQAVAESIRDAGKRGNISQGMLDGYASALASREDFKRATYGAFGGALALGIGAGALFLFDTPRPPTGFVRVDEAPARGTRPAAPLEVSALPLAGPGFVGAGVFGRF
jgi:tetratricopeptide (TPR) repeat protein